MPQVRVREDEGIERALRRFVNSCKREGVLSDMKAHRHFEKPSDRRKRKAKASRRRLLKRMARQRQDTP